MQFPEKPSRRAIGRMLAPKIEVPRFLGDIVARVLDVPFRLATDQPPGSLS